MDFGLKEWGEGLFVMKIFFTKTMLNEVLKNCEKWYLLMKKLIKTTRNKRSGGSILQNFYNMCLQILLQNLKYNINWACIFYLILVSILSILILSIYEQRVFFFFLLNGQNLLSMTKVICQHSPLD